MCLPLGEVTTALPQAYVVYLYVEVAAFLPVHHLQIQVVSSMCFCFSWPAIACRRARRF